MRSYNSSPLTVALYFCTISQGIIDRFILVEVGEMGAGDPMFRLY